MIRRDLLTGHWKPYLERAISLKPCYEGGINGGEVIFFVLMFYDSILGKLFSHCALSVMVIFDQNNSQDQILTAF